MKRNLLILTACITTSITVSAQFTLQNIPDWDRVKNDTTYVLLDSLSLPKNEPVEALFKQYWKVSPVRFIDSKDYENYLSPNASYLSLLTTVNGSTSMEHNPAAGMGRANMMATTVTPETSCQLWTCDEKYFKKKKDWNVRYMKTIVTTDIYKPSEQEAMAIAYNYKGPSYKTMRKEGVGNDFNEKLAKYGGVMGGVSQDVIRGGTFWGQGALKNYIQVLNALITANKKGNAVINNDALKNLKTGTLYVPDYIKNTKHYKMNMMGSVKEEKTKDIMADYKFKYATITIDDLNKKIMDTQTDFYYFMHAGDYIYVMDGLTGELVYAKEINDLNSDVLKELYKAIMKG